MLPIITRNNWRGWLINKRGTRGTEANKPAATVNKRVPILKCMVSAYAYPYGLRLRVELINRIYNWFIVEYRGACYGEFILKMLAEYGNYLKYVSQPIPPTRSLLSIAGCVPFRRIPLYRFKYLKLSEN